MDHKHILPNGPPPILTPKELPRANGLPANGLPVLEPTTPVSLLTPTPATPLSVATATPLSVATATPRSAATWTPNPNPSPSPTSQQLQSYPISSGNIVATKLDILKQGSSKLLFSVKPNPPYWDPAPLLAKIRLDGRIDADRQVFKYLQELLTFVQDSSIRLLPFRQKLSELNARESELKTPAYFNSHSRYHVMDEINNLMVFRRYLTANIQLIEAHRDETVMMGYLQQMIDSYFAIPFTDRNDGSWLQAFNFTFDINAASVKHLAKNHCPRCHKPLVAMKRLAFWLCLKCARLTLNLAPLNDTVSQAKKEANNANATPAPLSATAMKKMQAMQAISISNNNNGTTTALANPVANGASPSNGTSQIASPALSTKTGGGAASKSTRTPPTAMAQAASEAKRMKTIREKLEQFRNDALEIPHELLLAVDNCLKRLNHVDQGYFAAPTPVGDALKVLKNPHNNWDKFDNYKERIANTLNGIVFCSFTQVQIEEMMSRLKAIQKINQQLRGATDKLASHINFFFHQICLFMGLPQHAKQFPIQRTSASLKNQKTSWTIILKYLQLQDKQHEWMMAHLFRKGNGKDGAAKSSTESESLPQVTSSSFSSLTNQTTTAIK